MVNTKSLLKGLAFVSSLGAAAIVHAEPEYEFVIGYLNAPGSLSNEAVAAIPGIVDEVSDGRVKVTTTSTLVGENRLMEGLRDGVIDLALPNNGTVSGTSPEFQLTLLPGVSNGGIEKLMAILEVEEYRIAFDQMLAEKYNGVEVLSGAWCPQGLFSKHEITKVSDWRDSRVMAHNPGLSRVIVAMGARPMQLALTERIPALQRGVIDGVVGDACGAYGQGIYDVVEHVSLWPYGTTVPWHVIWNRDSLNRMPAELQETILTALRDYQEDVVIPRWNETAAALPDMYREKGVSWNEVSESEQQKMITEEVIRPIFDEWHKSMEARGVYQGDLQQLEQAVRSVSESSSIEGN